jgi:hypothetical protein
VVDWETLNKNMELEKQSNHGGAREGAGRPKGSTHKLTAKDLLDQCQAIVGKPFAVSLMEGYRDAILEGDSKTRVTYEKIIVDKVATTMLDVEVEDRGDLVDGKRSAFLEAIQALQLLNPDKEINNQKE